MTESSVVLPPEAGSRKCPHIAFLPSALISTFQACQKSLSALTTSRPSIKRCNLRTVSIWRFGTLGVWLRGFRVARQRYRPRPLDEGKSSQPSQRIGHSPLGHADSIGVNWPSCDIVADRIQNVSASLPWSHDGGLPCLWYDNVQHRKEALYWLGITAFRQGQRQWWGALQQDCVPADEDEPVIRGCARQ